MGNIQGQNRWDKASPREEKSSKRGTGDVPEEPGNKKDEQFDMRTHLVVTS